jgi:hypothetical protein
LSLVSQGKAALERSWAANAEFAATMTDDELLEWAVELQHELRREST